MRILYVTTVGLTMGFFKPLIQELTEAGHTVDIACNDSEFPVDPFYADLGCRVYSLSCSRSPLKADNLRAIGQIRKLVAENRYDIVHCHTPVAAACTRIACRKARRSGTRVIYTAHGFHFYKGAPRKNWLMYYPVEKLCARLTDTLITINKEDYALARKKLKAKHIEYVPGVGIDVQKFADTTIDKAAKRAEIGVPDDAFLLLSVGELNRNKNHETVIRAVAALQNGYIHYAIAGKGALHSELCALADSLGIGGRVHLLGYRDDIAALYKAADVFVHPSFREGLPVSVTEAMASGLPVIASNIRGNADLIADTAELLCDPQNKESFEKAIRMLAASSAEAARIGAINQTNADQYDQSRIRARMAEIYSH
ncbi:MAG: glycosyltransferase family 4 protein [Clostridia bacterium]|nr:glycosyltransferase family 4 protein [Clostridia bacterium]